MKEFAVYDLEIKTPIENLPKKWEDHALMGISCLGLYDYAEDRYKVYDDHNKAEFLDRYFNNPNCVLISFNGYKFDDRVVKTNWENGAAQKRSYESFDILDAVWKSLGKMNFHKGVSLDALCQATLFTGKSGSGEFAPALYLENRIAELVTYCLHDVWLTKRLFDFVRTHGFVMSPTLGKINVEIPKDAEVVGEA